MCDGAQMAIFGDFFASRIFSELHVSLNHCGSDIALEKLSNIVDLGVNFDDKLSFKDHITDKTNKAYGVIGIIKRNFDNLSTVAFNAV